MLRKKMLGVLALCLLLLSNHQVYAAAYDYAFVSQDLPPTTMIVGEQYTFYFKVRNTGTETWTRSVVKLGTENPQDRASDFYQSGAYGWESANRIRLKESSVAPNEIGTFEATVIAPTRPDTYFEPFRLVADGVGWITTGPELSFQVTVEEETYDYAFYSQDLPPSTMTPGEQYTFNFKVRNTGTATWTPDVVRLGTEQPQDRNSAFYQSDAYGWESANRILLKESSVAPNGIGTFEATVTAPTTPDTYFEPFRLVADGVGWITTGPELSFQVTVEESGYNYVFDSQNLPPSTMTPGEQYTFNFKVRNTGTATWTPDVVRLGTEQPQDRNSVFYQSDAYGWESANRIRLKENSVAPNEIGTFEATVTAPSTPDTYFEPFRLVADGVGWITTGPELSFEVTIQGISDYAYEFVTQDLPPDMMLPGEQSRFYFQVRNTGSATWTNAFVKLGTENSRDRDSDFYLSGGDGWLSTNRIELKELSVAPNELATFEAVVAAPADSGQYTERFRVVVDGVGWIETGPELSFDVEVRGESAYAYTVSSQDLPPETMNPGDQDLIYFKVLNTGYATWTPDVVKLGTDVPRDRSSRFYREEATGWLSSNRIRFKEASVAPGEIATFEALVTAPSTANAYIERFRVVADGITWIDSGPELSFAVSVGQDDPQGFQILSNPSFDDSYKPTYGKHWVWEGDCNFATGDATHEVGVPQGGQYFLATNRKDNPNCKAFYQDVVRYPQAGETYTFKIAVRSSHPGMVRRGEVVIWAIGGGEPEQKSAQLFAVDSTSWQDVSTSITIADSGWEILRAQVYLQSDDHLLGDYHFDEAALFGPPAYSISGRVRNIAGGPVAKATIVTSIGRSAVTNSSGYYTLDYMPPGNYTIAAAKTGCDFTPAQRENIVVPPDTGDQDFVGCAPPPMPKKGKLSVMMAEDYEQNSYIPVNYMVINTGVDPNLHSYALVGKLYAAETKMHVAADTPIESYTDRLITDGVNSGTFDFSPQKPGAYRVEVFLYEWVESGDHLGEVIETKTFSFFVFNGQSQHEARIKGRTLVLLALDELEWMEDQIISKYQATAEAAADFLASTAKDKLVKWLSKLVVDSDSQDTLADIIEEQTGIDFGGESGSKEALMFSFKEILSKLVEHLLSKHVLTSLKNGVYSDIGAFKSGIAKEWLVFGKFVGEHDDFVWNDAMERSYKATADIITTRVEEEPVMSISMYTKVDIGSFSNLVDMFDIMENALTLLQEYGVVITLVMLLLMLVIAVLSFIPTGGTSLVAIGNIILNLGGGILKRMGYIEKIATIITILLMALLQLTGAKIVAPAIEQATFNGFQDLRNLIDPATQRMSEQPTAYVYSADGRIVQILRGGSRQATAAYEPRRDGAKIVTFAPPGHSPQRAPTVNYQATIPQPDVLVAVHLDSAQASPGATLNASILVTNTHTVSPTGALTLEAVSGFTETQQTWTVDLGPGESQTYAYTFAPEKAGAGLLRVTLNDVDGQLLRVQDAAYVIGEGAAIALNWDTQVLYSPGLTITVPVQVANAGTVPTTTLLTLATRDVLRETTSYDTISLTLAAGETRVVSSTALTQEAAHPGIYRTRVLLGGDYYAGFEFTVSAEDTLFATIDSGEIYYKFGETVPLTVSVADSTFVATDPTDIALYVQQPDGEVVDVPLDYVETGTYTGTYTAAISGTFAVNTVITKACHRVVEDDWIFVVGEASFLKLMVIEGTPVAGEDNAVNFTISNEYGKPVVGAIVTLSNTHEYLSQSTDDVGQVNLSLSPDSSVPYQVEVHKIGFATTHTELTVQPNRDSNTIYLPLILRDYQRSSPPLDPPTMPTNLQVKVLSSTRLHLTWRDNSNNETGFYVYQQPDNHIATVGNNITTYTITNLSPATEYCYYITAFNDAGESEWSSNYTCATTSAAYSGIYGTVTYQAQPISDIYLTLQFYDGVSWSAVATVTTQQDGAYQFWDVADLSTDQKYRVKYLNGSSGNVIDSNYLYWWNGPEITTYASGQSKTGGDFDIANLFLVSTNGAAATLPYTFQWERRTTSPSDSYEFILYDPSNGDTWWSTDPFLGYVSDYTVASLPTGFGYGIEYGWSIRVHSPDGGYGGTSHTSRVTFSQDEGLVAYWALDEALGNIASDSSVNNNTGTIYNATWTAGKQGAALAFDGDNDYMQVPDSTSLDMETGMTIAAWVKPNTICDGNNPILQKDNSYGLKILSTGQVVGFRWYGPETHASSTQLTTGMWYHVAATFDGQQHKIYINGVLENSEDEGNIQTIATSTMPLFLGHGAFSCGFVGSIDEIYVYDYALTSAEIQSLMSGR